MSPNRSLELPHGTLQFPVFLPDATKGVVRSVDSHDLEILGLQGLVMNTFHLMQHPGSSTIKSLGGLHQMTGWSRPIITDSGGFQIYSLIRQNAKYGSLSDKGATFQTDGNDRKFNLTPEKSIQLQIGYGADILFCLDDCTHADDPASTQRESVQRTIKWAKRCKQEFSRLIAEKKLSESQRPLLFGVVQGGNNPDLRRECAEVLLEIGFDGYGYGGYPLDGDGNLLTDIIGYTRELIPSEFPMHALGVGHPANIVACYRLGYDIFDSAMPTRDARNGRLYAFTQPEIELGQPNWFEYVYIGDDKFIKADQPLGSYNTAWVSQRYSRGYLKHLFDINDMTASRLATLHNLGFIQQLMDHLRQSAR